MDQNSLQERIKKLPDSPGVYQYFDRDGKLLYVGKAKSLKKRVKSYFRYTPKLSPAPNLSPRIHKMLLETASLSYIVVDSEHDALILENSLIKQLNPKYNILLRDDKTYPYIYIDLSEDFPRFKITRKVVKGKKIRYFGPFSTAAREILDSIYELFPLVQREGDIKKKSLCLFYQIKRCLGPCEGKVSKEVYKELVDEAMELLYNKKSLLAKLQEKMEEYASTLRFEDAARIRDAIEKIKSSSAVSNIDLAKLEDYDIFAIYIGEKEACGIRIFIRDGRVVSSTHSVFKSQSGFDKAELYRRFLLSYYQNELVVLKDILLYEAFEDMESIERFLEKKFKRKVNLTVPKIGQKRRLTELAYQNAKELIKKEKKGSDEILTKLQKLLNLSKTPYVIEGYDNSHLGGEATVGAVIKWDGTFIKKEYKHYNLEAKDEYAQMRELLSRRVEKFSTNPPPDLMVIDGGETLLKLAIQIVKEKGANVDIVAVAKEKIDHKANRSKGKARDIIYTKDGALRLSSSDERLHFLQNIRDEAHRFVINYHKKVKLRRDQKISLLKTKGVGEGSIKKLLQYFETFSNIQKASYEELKRVVGANIALKIKNIK